MKFHCPLLTIRTFCTVPIFLICGAIIQPMLLAQDVPPIVSNPSASTPSSTVIRTESRMVLVDAVATDKKAITFMISVDRTSRFTKTIKNKI
jgi:hypothetical protein